MRRLTYLILISILLPSLSFAANFIIDANHSAANFTIKHLMITNVRGTIPDISGSVTFDQAKPEQSVFKASLQVASIDTRNGERDDHLRSADFFDVANFPAMTFDSSSVKKLGPGLYEVKGQLTIRGVSKPVTLSVEGLEQEVTDPWGNVKRGARVTGEIDRRDFGITWNKAIETGGVVVGHKVKFEAELQLVKQ